MLGLFITFEGTEASGKSTQILMLAERLRKQGIPVITLREPGGTLIGEEIRHTLKHSRDNAAMTSEAELLLLSASRAQLVREVIRPSLQRGDTVLCDRFLDSTTAYQAYGRGLSLRTVEAINDFAVGETLPDMTLFLRVSIQKSEERRRARQNAVPQPRDRFEESDSAFFQRVAEGYEAIAHKHSERFKVIDAEFPVEIVHQAIWQLVSTRLAATPP